MNAATTLSMVQMKYSAIRPLRSTTLISWQLMSTAEVGPGYSVMQNCATTVAELPYLSRPRIL